MFRYYCAQAFPNGLYGEHSGLNPVCMGTLGAEPNYEVRPRILKHFYLVYFLKGKGTLRTKGDTFPLKEKDLYVLYPDVIHAYWTDPEDLIDMYWIGFQGADAAFLIKEAGFLPEKPVFHCADNPRIEKIIDQMVSDSGDDRPDNFLSLCGDLYRLFGALIGQRTANKPWTVQNRELSDLVNHAQNFINIHYPQNITVEDVASHLSVSRATLAARFRTELGKTPGQYLTYVRMQQAVNLLDNTKFSVAEVAHSVGYPDALYFSKVFSKELGLSPSAYRSKKLEEQKSQIENTEDFQ